MFRMEFWWTENYTIITNKFYLWTIGFGIEINNSFIWSKNKKRTVSWQQVIEIYNWVTDDKKLQLPYMKVSVKTDENSR